jgi:Leucine-rich repeat (LRR) protein
MICTSRSSSSPVTSSRLQLYGIGLTEVPSELFRMTKVKRLFVSNNKICSLPSDIGHLTTLEKLGVRLSKQSGAI